MLLQKSCEDNKAKLKKVQELLHKITSCFLCCYRVFKQAS